MRGRSRGAALSGRRGHGSSKGDVRGGARGIDQKGGTTSFGATAGVRWTGFHVPRGGAQIILGGRRPWGDGGLDVRTARSTSGEKSRARSGSTCSRGRVDRMEGHRAGSSASSRIYGHWEPAAEAAQARDRGRKDLQLRQLETKPSEGESSSLRRPAMAEQKQERTKGQAPARGGGGYGPEGPSFTQEG